MSELEHYEEVYGDAIYYASDGDEDLAFTLSQKETGANLFGGRAFTLVTAQNPQSTLLSDEENRERNERLEQHLLDQEYEFGSSTGESPVGDWREEGFTVFDLSLEDALALGSQFGQHAVVYGRGERVALAWCESGRLEWFYPKLLPLENESLTS